MAKVRNEEVTANIYESIAMYLQEVFDGANEYPISDMASAIFDKVLNYMDKHFKVELYTDDEDTVIDDYVIIAVKHVMEEKLFSDD